MNKTIKIPNPCTDKSLYLVWTLWLIATIYFIIVDGFLSLFLFVFPVNLMMTPIYIMGVRVYYSVTFINDETISNGYYNFKTNTINWSDIDYICIGSGKWTKGNYPVLLHTMLVSTVRPKKQSIFSPATINRNKQALLLLSKDNIDDVLAIINERFELSLTRELIALDVGDPPRIIWCYTDANNGTSQKALVQ